MGRPRLQLALCRFLGLRERELGTARRGLLPGGYVRRQGSLVGRFDGFVGNPRRPPGRSLDSLDRVALTRRLEAKGPAMTSIRAQRNDTHHSTHRSAGTPQVLRLGVLGLLAAATLAPACGGGGGGITNHAPTITAPAAATPNPVVGGALVQLSVTATDSNGDALTYTWSQMPSSPAGTFGSQAASTTWTAPVVTTGTSYELTVAVSDGHATARGTSTLYVKTAATPSFANDVEPIFNRPNNPPGCTACHGGGAPIAPPQLIPAIAWAGIVGVNATQGCTSQKLVMPGDPDASVLVKRITGGTCGAEMPPAAPDYFNTHPGELTTIRSWISAGAPNN